jgi:pantetheine-phosphate adenylyltransferase
MASHAFFAGSFDPFTLGHLDLVRRAQALFGRVTVGVAHDPAKHSRFSAAERVELVRQCVVGLSGVEVVQATGLVVDAARSCGADVLVRGVRSGTDFDYEMAMARTNRDLAGLDTVLLVPQGDYAHVSSTLVRQIAAHGGDVARFVPPPVAAALARKPSTS